MTVAFNGGTFSGSVAISGIGAGVSVGVNSIPASGNASDKISAYQEAAVLMDSFTERGAQYAYADLAQGATTQLVAAQGAGVKILVVQLYLKAPAGTALTTTLKSNVTQIGPTFDNAAALGEVLGFSPFGWLITAANVALNATVTAGTGTVGCLVGWIPKS